MIDTFDRTGKAYTAGTYAGAGTFADGFEDKPGKRIPKAGLYASAGVGLARAEWRFFDAEAKGPYEPNPSKIHFLCAVLMDD
ncbi:hypothetical protein EXN66_Car013041 [Channa argus]|uniref:Uncharacterized protein n=1 Tax=Channa argus TaxID=215402 RepID=A0A6G1Q418_CHAAH|nr:hypothetical protein EXN66_Car013041 [Channa argus]